MVIYFSDDLPAVVGDRPSVLENRLAVSEKIVDDAVAA